MPIQEKIGLFSFLLKITLKNIGQIYPKKQIFQNHVMNSRQSAEINRSMIFVDFLKK